MMVGEGAKIRNHARTSGNECDLRKKRGSGQSDEGVGRPRLMIIRR